MPPFIWSDAGVYCISCEANGKKYVGLSKCVMKRLTTHFSLLNKGKHSNSHLQHSWNKYGASAFCVFMLSYGSDDIQKNEIDWIKEFDTLNNGFNQTAGGDDCAELSEEKRAVVRTKITEALRKKETRAKIGDWSKKFWEENYETMRGARSGAAKSHWKKYTPEQRRERALKVWDKRRANKEAES